MSAAVVSPRRQQEEAAAAAAVAPKMMKTMKVLVSQLELPGSIPDWSDCRWMKNLLRLWAPPLGCDGSCGEGPSHTHTHTRTVFIT